MSAGSGHESRATRLARMARSLKLKPERAPFYVQHATPECPLVGWYWQPAGAERPVPLAANYETAIAQLIDAAKTTEKTAA